MQRFRSPRKVSRRRFSTPRSHGLAHVGISARVYLAALVGLVAACLGCRSGETPPSPPARSPSAPIQLRDVSAQTGISFVHTDGGSGERYIVETVTAGLALFDYDGDGLTDVYFLNGAPLRGTASTEIPRNALYRNEGDWKFTDATERAGVGDPGFGLGVAAADYDNDGDADLFLNNYGPNVLYRNNGDGTFTDVTDEAGVSGGHQVGAGACFLDYDADGHLDLYVANYVDFTYENHCVQVVDGFPVYAGPRDFRPVADQLYRNNGDGTFTDKSAETGIGDHAGTGMGMVCADHDNDGDTDVFVLNDVSGNFFFENDGAGRFHEVGLLSGAAYNLYGDELGSMGIDCADYDNDGRLDFFMTSYQGELPVLYHNLGDGGFEDVTVSAGVGKNTLPYVNWGTGLIDFDNDGDRDLFIANGHLYDNVDRFDDSTAYHVRNALLLNAGDGTFVDVSDSSGDGMAVELSSRGAAFDDLDNDGDVSDSSGDGMAVELSSRGAAFDDLDNDGDVDAVVLNSRREPTILRNDSPGGNHWLQIRLRGTRSNRDGVGAHVKVVAGDLVQLDEVHSGRGYQSHWGRRLHFGLGPHDRVDRIEVRWIGGGVDVLHDLPADRRLVITEGSGSK